jgi:acyl dehydratase
MYTPDSLRGRIGEELGVSGWCPIDQDMIDRFADLTDDHQWIHVDREAAARGPFGAPIAHGFLVLSLMSKLVASLGIELHGARMGMNYGFDKVRITNVVRAGSRIRARCVLKDLTERSPGQWLMTFGLTVEIEGESKPAVVADWLALQFIA